MIPEVLLSNGFFYVSVGCLFLLVALALRDIARILIKQMRSFFLKTNYIIERSKRPFYVKLYNKIMFYFLYPGKDTQENIYLILKYDPLDILKEDSE